MSLCDENLRGFGPHFPHHFDVSKVKAIYSDGEVIDPHNFRNGIPHQKWTSAPHGLAVLRHYGLKSAEEYAARRKRGSGKGDIDDRYQDSYFKLYDQNEIYDPVDNFWVKKVKNEMVNIFSACNLSRNFDPSYFGINWAQS